MNQPDETMPTTLGFAVGRGKYLSAPEAFLDKPRWDLTDSVTIYFMLVALLSEFVLWSTSDASFAVSNVVLWRVVLSTLFAILFVLMIGCLAYRWVRKANQRYPRNGCSGYGFGSGYGDGYGYGDGSGFGSRAGYGDGNGYGDSSGSDSRAEYGDGNGDGSGSGSDTRSGFDSGSGYGDGSGDGHG